MSALIKQRARRGGRARGGYRFGPLLGLFEASVAADERRVILLQTPEPLHPQMDPRKGLLVELSRFGPLLPSLLLAGTVRVPISVPIFIIFCSGGSRYSILDWRLRLGLGLGLIVCSTCSCRGAL
jgi:hypothetical protein